MQDRSDCVGQGACPGDVSTRKRSVFIARSKGSHFIQIRRVRITGGTAVNRERSRSRAQQHVEQRSRVDPMGIECTSDARNLLGDWVVGTLLDIR